LIIAQAPKGAEAVGTKLPHRLLELFNRDNRNIEKIADDDGVEKLVAYSPLHAGQEGLFLALTSTWGKKPGRYDDERGCTCS